MFRDRVAKFGVLNRGLVQEKRTFELTNSGSSGNETSQRENPLQANFRFERVPSRARDEGESENVIHEREIYRNLT